MNKTKMNSGKTAVAYNAASKKLSAAFTEHRVAYLVADAIYNAASKKLKVKRGRAYDAADVAYKAASAACKTAKATWLATIGGCSGVA